MAEAELIDTSAIHALNLTFDPYYGRARAHSIAFSGRLHTTAPALEESFTLMRRRAGYDTASRVVDSLRRSDFVTIHFIDRDFDADIWKKLETLRGIPLSYVDASLIVLGERLRIRRIFTFDEDFREAGLEVVPGDA